MWHIEQHLQSTCIITSATNGPSKINVATLSENCRGVNSTNSFRNHFPSYFTYLGCSIYYVNVSVKSWRQCRNVHHTTQHLTFTMPCYSFCTLKSSHFHKGNFCHASGHTVTSSVHSHCTARVLCPYARHYHIPWLLCIYEHAHLTHTYITYLTSTTTATHIHFTVTNYTVSCCYHSHCCVLHALLHYHLHFFSMPVLHLLQFCRAFPTKVTLQPLNTAIA